MLIKNHPIKGQVLDVKENSYDKKDGTKVKEEILYVHVGGKNVYEISVPLNSGVQLGDTFDGNVDIYTSVYNGRELVNCKLSEDK